MKPPAELKSLVEQRTWEKEVVLWVGTETALAKLLGPVHHATLDLLDLFDEDKLPMDDEETRQCMVAVLSTDFRPFLLALGRGWFSSSRQSVSWRGMRWA